MAAENWKLHENAKEYIGDGTIDLDDDLFHMVLCTSSYSRALSDDTYGDLTEVANGNGYTTGGEALTSVTWGQTSGTATFDCADVEWTASGGAITARYAVIVHVAAGTGLPQSTDKIVCSCLLDDTPADVTASDGGTFTVAINASGVFTLSGGAS